MNREKPPSINDKLLMLFAEYDKQRENGEQRESLDEMIERTFSEEEREEVRRLLDQWDSRR